MKFHPKNLEFDKTILRTSLCYYYRYLQSFFCRRVQRSARSYLIVLNFVECTRQIELHP